jgi:hypothetical protein
MFRALIASDHHGVLKKLHSWVLVVSLFTGTELPYSSLSAAMKRGMPNRR